MPIVKKSAKLIYYASDSWNRCEFVVSPGCISRKQFETDTCYQRGYRGSAGQLFFATHEAAEANLYHAGQQVGHCIAAAPIIKELRRAMADVHPDRGGTTAQFIRAHRRYLAALQDAQS